jgi:hypothetical protein
VELHGLRGKAEAWQIHGAGQEQLAEYALPCGDTDDFQGHRPLKKLSPAKFDSATAKEIMSMPWRHYFKTKLHVSHYCPAGCLAVRKDRKV